MAKWVHVNTKKGPDYRYLKIAGGWLVTLPTTGSLTFVSDPKHSTPPVPAE
jgi:hypothetical protein